MNDFDDTDSSVDEKIQGKPVNSNTLDVSIIDILLVYGSLFNCFELTPSEISRANLRAENLICVRQFKKGRWQLDRYPVSLSGLRVFKIPRSSSSGVSPASVMIGAASKTHYDISPTVFIDTPSIGAVIELTNKIYVIKYFVYHDVAKGETVQSIVKKITGGTDLSVIQELNYQPYTIGQIIYPDNLLKIENGKALKISGNATNSNVVVLTLTGAINATKTLNLAKAGDNILVGFDTEFKIEEYGAVKIEAEAISDTGHTKYVSQAEITPPNWVDIEYKVDGQSFNTEGVVILRFDDGTTLRGTLDSGFSHFPLVPFMPFSVEFVPSKEKQKELDKFYNELDTLLTEKVAEAKNESETVTKIYEKLPWFIKNKVNEFYTLKGAGHWMVDTATGLWALVSGAAQVIVQSQAWIAEFQLRHLKMGTCAIAGDQECVKAESEKIATMMADVGDDASAFAETAKTIYYLANDGKTATRLKQFGQDYFNALSVPEQHQFVTRYGIDILLLFVGGSGAALFGIKKTEQITAIIKKIADVLKTFPTKVIFKKVKGDVNNKNTFPPKKPKIVPPVKMKQAKLPCFKKGGNLKKNFKGSSKQLDKGYKKQLKKQEAGLNDMTVGEYRKRRENYIKNKRVGTGTAQEIARSDYETEIKSSLKESLLRKNKNLARKELKAKASEKTKTIMDELAALHDPDMVAGGKDKVTKLGNKRINSSIGNQWKSRVKELDKQVEEAYKKHGDNTKMNVKLDVCGK